MSLKTRHDIFIKLCAESANRHGQCISLDIPPGDEDVIVSWRLESNPGDGHCFYHAILRGLRDLYPQLDLIMSLKRGEILPVYEYRKAIVRIRQMLLNNFRSENFIKMEEEQKKVNDAARDPSISPERLEQINKTVIRTIGTLIEDENRMELGLEEAKKGKIVPSACYASEREVETTSRLFNVCIAIWYHGQAGRDGYWLVSGPSGGSGYVVSTTLYGAERIETGYQDLANKGDCPDVIFLSYTGGNHFDNLIPIIHELEEPELKAPEAEPKKKPEAEPKKKPGKVDGRSCMYRYGNTKRRKGPKGKTCKQGGGLDDKGHPLGCCLDEPWLTHCNWIPNQGCALRAS